MFASGPQQISREGHQLLASEVAGYRTSDFPAFFTPIAESPSPLGYGMLRQGLSHMRPRSGLTTSCSS